MKFNKSTTKQPNNVTAARVSRTPNFIFATPRVSTIDTLAFWISDSPSMWRSLWRSSDRFSLQYFKYIIHELRQIEVVDRNNRELVVDILQSIVEIVTYGDRHDPLIFECFMEYQVLAEFVRVLKISRNSRIEAPLLQYLSIMIQNMDSEHATYYCFSNDYINSIIAHKFDFDGGDLAPYYISFLRAVSGKMNRDTLCLLAKVDGDIVISFPLYSEALKFAHHAEKMIQIAVRALTLNVYNVGDDLVYQFVTTAPVSKYFADLVERLRKQCIHLDAIVHSTKETCTQERRKVLQIETDKFVDDLYYFKDILSVGESRLNRLVTQNLLRLLVFPILLPLLELRKNNGLNLSAITSLYILSRTLQVVGGKNIIDSVAGVILYTCVTSIRSANDGDTVDGTSPTSSFLDHLDEMVCLDLEFQGAENIDLFGHLAEYISSDSHFMKCLHDNACTKRGGILAYIFSDNHSQMLASLYLLLVLAESKDLDYSLASMTGLNQMQELLIYETTTDSQPADGSIFLRFLPQIFNVLVKVLGSQSPFSALVQWHTGWFLQKLLVFHKERLSDHNLQLFNNSYEQSCELLQKELDGCWFDFIPDTLRNEWASCKTVLQESIQDKDPCFTLELADCEPITDGSTTYLAWKRMNDAVKVFILHLHLKAIILQVDLPGKPLLNIATSPDDSGRTHVSDILSASFGSEVVLGSGVPCKIAFSNAGIRDIYLVPVASGISGKLLLAEKHPFRSQKGIVFAIAPLAGLRPKINDEHPTWLHLQLREFTPKFDVAKTQDHQMSNNVADGRFTLGFPNAEACKFARSLILKETSKQRSSVESIIAPLLQKNYLEES